MPTSADDYAHVIAACLFHDIGYVRGVLKEDGADGYVIDSKGGKTALARGSSDAALMPYHVDRSKLFVKEHIARSELLDADRISSAIECTRFPPVHGPNDENSEGFLVRAADLIGQLGDPHYLRKANALYHEFEEVGMNRQLGYSSPILRIDIRSFIGVVFPCTSNLLSGISTLPRADDSGSQIFIVMFSAPNWRQCDWPLAHHDRPERNQHNVGKGDTNCPLTTQSVRAFWRRSSTCLLTKRPAAIPCGCCPVR